MSTASRMVSGTGTSPPSASSSPRRPGVEEPGDEQRVCELLDEERDALGAVVGRADERRRGCRREDLLGEPLAGLGAVKRRQRHLLQAPGAAQLVA